jgi:nicotinate-nucleotide pyrophosphorylase (carboxylating)
MLVNLPSVRNLIALAIEEDLSLGDVTCDSSIDESCTANAVIIAREPQIFCGSGLIAEIAHFIDPQLSVTVLVKDGASVKDMDVIANLSGKASSLLKAERTILNFLQRLSGIATATQRYVQSLTRLALLDTRKTTPGWRALEKYAVRVGGGRNHRYNLGDMILVKNNHIDANGGSVLETLKRVFARKPLYTPVEIEVRDQAELKHALAFPIQAILLDNMNNDEVAQCVGIIRAVSSSIVIEASGGITPERLLALESMGVDAVSMGALTTKATNVDISMRIKLS